MSPFPIIDTHLHLWDPKTLRYPWLDSSPMLNNPFLLNDYAKATETFSIEKMVFVQCEVDVAQYRQETQWITEQAKVNPKIQGIVSWAPLERGPAVECEIAALTRNKLVKGVRRIIQFEANPDFCVQPDFVKGVQLLSKYGLSFDICVKGPAQTANAIKLIEACPNVNFILDHIGKPFIKEREQDPWRDHIRDLSAFPNVWCKMSGLIVEADHKGWTTQDLTPYIDHVLKTFGTKRVMFGGDWPVVLHAGPLKVWIDTLKSATAALSPSEQKRIFYDNAVSFYRL